MDGNFYGTTNAGGASGLGTIFEWQTGGSYFEMFDFSGDGGLVPAGRGGEGLLRYSRVSHGRLIFDQAVW
jgi:uncharacterized repeat protein (TIGR03803 family)